MPAFLAQYFTKNEMETAIEDSAKPVEDPSLSGKKKKKTEIFESDSEPSVDNFELAEMKAIFNEALSETDFKE